MAIYIILYNNYMVSIFKFSWNYVSYFQDADTEIEKQIVMDDIINSLPQECEFTGGTGDNHGKLVSDLF